MEPQQDVLLTAKEAAELMRCSLSYVYKLMETGRITHLEHAGKKLWKKDVLAYLLANTIPARTTPSPHFHHLDGEKISEAWQKR